jgi:hypothetical protein
MEWGAAQIALAIVGTLFLSGVVVSLHPRFSLSLASRVVLSAAAGLYLAAALAVRGSDPLRYAPLIWLASVVVVAVVARDGLRHGTPRWPHRSAIVGRASAPSPRVTTLLEPTASSAELEELAYTTPEARSAVAAHAETPASVLSWLAHQGDDAVVAAIAARQESGDAGGNDR